MAAPQKWEVVGGSKGGIVVREGGDLKSTAIEERLAKGATIEEVSKVGGRLQYKLLSGQGPETGWVSLTVGGKDLVVNKKFDPYKILGINWDATNAEIKSAYRRASLKVHPDKDPSPGAAEMFRELIRARDFLLNPFKRALYNMKNGVRQKQAEVEKYWSDWDDIFDEIDFTADEQDEHPVESPQKPLPSADDRTDILVIGATGFIGTLVCRTLLQSAPNRTFAIAGRDERKLGKLEENLRIAPQFRGANCIRHDDYIKALARTARLVIDASGPKLSGIMDAGIVTEACISAGAHLVDVGGFKADVIARAQLPRDDIDQRAKATGVAVIHFCGWECAYVDIFTWAVVQFVREKYSLPTGEMNVYRSYQTMHGGAWMKSSAGDGKLIETEKKLGIFMLGGERPCGVRERDQQPLVASYSDEFDVWMSPVAFPERVVVRGSCGMMDKIQPYGDNFLIRLFNLAEDRLGAERGIYGDISIAKQYDKILEREQIPPLGTGIKEHHRLGRTQLVAYTATADGSGADNMQVHAILRAGPGGMGDAYEASAATCVTAASCVLDALDDDRGAEVRHGYGTPVFHLAHFGFLQRLQAYEGIDFRLFEGPAPADLLKSFMGGIAALGAGDDEP